mgnify:CR=1 FL=1
MGIYVLNFRKESERSTRRERQRVQENRSEMFGTEKGREGEGQMGIGTFLREAAKKSSYSGPTTMRIGGVKAEPLRKNDAFYETLKPGRKKFSGWTTSGETIFAASLTFFERKEH